MLITQASSEQSICFAVPAPASPTVVESLKQAFAGELVNLDIDRIWDSDDVAIITVVGAGMIHTPGVAGQIFSALGAHGVNVIAIAQGSSEVSISLVVDGTDNDTRALAAGARLDVGVHFLSQVLTEWVARQRQRRDAGKGQQRRRGKRLGRLQHRIAHADIHVKGLEGPAGHSGRDEEAPAAVGRSG